MTVTNAWAVVQMDAYRELDGEADVVFTVHWTLTGTERAYTGSVYGSVGVTVDPEVPFIPFAELTQDEVIGWVKSALGDDQVASYEANVAQQIADLASPPVVTPPLPWSA